MGIQGPGNRTPAVLDDLLGKLPRIDFSLEFAGRANAPALCVVALGHYVRTVRNVPDIGLYQALNLEQVERAATSKRQLST